MHVRLPFLEDSGVTAKIELDVRREPSLELSPLDGDLEVLEVRAMAEGVALVLAGEWLDKRAGTTEERIIEGIDWAPPGDHRPRATLLVTLSRLYPAGEN